MEQTSIYALDGDELSPLRSKNPKIRQSNLTHHRLYKETPPLSVNVPSASKFRNHKNDGDGDCHVVHSQLNPALNSPRFQLSSPSNNNNKKKKQEQVKKIKYKIDKFGNKKKIYIYKKKKKHF